TRQQVTCVVLCNDENFPSVLFPIVFEVYTGYPKTVNDASILAINSPQTNSCEALVSPEVVLQNYGSASLTAVKINYRSDNDALHTFNWSGNLASDETTVVSLPSFTPVAGSHSFTVFTAEPNGGEEGYHWNDTVVSHFVSHGAPVSSLVETFDGEFPPAGWLN